MKILFEDAATGARSPALVRQGQIGEIVNAKPEQRRRILEDAAGIAGLHSRRHEAELRLKAAEANLARLSDVLGQLNTPGREPEAAGAAARRYKEISDEIRKLDALRAASRWTDAQAHVDGEEANLRERCRSSARRPKPNAGADAPRRRRPSAWSRCATRKRPSAPPSSPASRSSRRTSSARRSAPPSASASCERASSSSAATWRARRR